MINNIQQHHHHNQSKSQGESNELAKRLYGLSTGYFFCGKDCHRQTVMESASNGLLGGLCLNGATAPLNLVFVGGFAFSF